MQRIIAFIILASVKTFALVFYRGNFKWLGNVPANPWKDVRLFVFMNHTSLFEPLFVRVFPYSYIWELAGHMNVPGADITLNRPIVGRFWKLMMPNIASVTRKKDSSWDQYLQSIKPDSIIMIAAEGRMKRPNGLDKNGRPMTIRGGAADIIEGIPQGKMVFCLSGGLHHIQSPGQFIPKVFKDISMNLIYLDIEEYKKNFPENSRERKLAIVQDLQKNLETNCPN